MLQVKKILSDNDKCLRADLSHGHWKYLEKCQAVFSSNTNLHVIHPVTLATGSKIMVYVPYAGQEGPPIPIQ